MLFIRLNGEILETSIKFRFHYLSYCHQGYELFYILGVLPKLLERKVLGRNLADLLL